jgi:hypothetical protein
VKLTGFRRIAYVIAHRGVVGRDVAYIAKRYTPDALAAKVREVLEGF